MTGDEKITEIMNTFNQIQEIIDKKVNKIKAEIEKFNEELDKLDSNESQHSEDYVKKQKEKINKKIEKSLEDIEAIMNDMKNKAQAWLDKEKESIMKSIADELQVMIEALTGMIK